MCGRECVTRRIIGVDTYDMFMSACRDGSICSCVGELEPDRTRRRHVEHWHGVQV